MQINNDVRLYCGDCTHIMDSNSEYAVKAFGDKSIDMILCDLPYGILNKTNHNAKWDSVIEFEVLWNQYLRLIKDNGAIVLFGSGMFTSNLMQSQKKLWRYNLIWDKVAKSGFLNANRMPLRQHEDICVFYKKLPVYNPQMIPCEPHKRNHTKGNLKNPSKNNCYGSFVEVPTVISDVKYPTSIISIPKEHCNGKFFHPTQKPVELMEWLIRTYTNEGDIVLDNCMGSGSTGVACVNTNRKFIGIEKEEKYFDIAKARIKESILKKQEEQ